MMGPEKDKQDQRHVAIGAAKVDPGDGASFGHLVRNMATVSLFEIDEPSLAISGLPFSGVREGRGLGGVCQSARAVSRPEQGPELQSGRRPTVDLGRRLL